MPQDKRGGLHAAFGAPGPGPGVRAHDAPRPGAEAADLRVKVSLDRAGMEGTGDDLYTSDAFRRMKGTKTSQWWSDLAACVEDSKHARLLRNRQLAGDTQETMARAGEKP